MSYCSADCAKVGHCVVHYDLNIVGSSILQVKCQISILFAWYQVSMTLHPVIVSIPCHEIQVPVPQIVLGLNCLFGKYCRKSRKEMGQYIGASLSGTNHNDERPALTCFYKEEKRGGVRNIRLSS